MSPLGLSLIFFGFFGLRKQSLATELARPSLHPQKKKKLVPVYTTIPDIDLREFCKHTNYKVDFTVLKISVKYGLRLANNRSKYAENNYIYAFMFYADRLNFFLLHAIYVLMYMLGKLRNIKLIALDIGLKSYEVRNGVKLVLDSHTTTIIKWTINCQTQKVKGFFLLRSCFTSY